MCVQVLSDPQRMVYMLDFPARHHAMSLLLSLALIAVLLVVCCAPAGAECSMVLILASMCACV